MKKITIIGAGLGGLTAGALLSKRGHRVTILEQHNIVGGCATTFRRKGGYTCEVGLHEMDSAFLHGKKEIFETLGVYDNIELVQTKEFYRVVADGIDFTMPENREDAIEKLVSLFPSEAKNINKYFGLIETITKEFEKLMTAAWWQYALFPLLFSNTMKYRKTSTLKAMDDLFGDEKLKLILNANVGYYSDKIENLSFLYHAMGQSFYFTGGGWYIKGGSQKLSDYLASVVISNGGEVITRANVVKIDKHSVEYVRKKETISIHSDIIVSNLSPQDTYRLANIEYQEDRKIASAIMTIYIGFKNNIKSVYGESSYTTFFFDGVSDMRDYDKMIDRHIVQRGFAFTDYSQIDSGLTDDDRKSFGVIITTDFMEDWKGLPDGAYYEQKEKLIESFLNKLETKYPNIIDHIEFTEAATAKTVNRYTKTPNGTAYGFAPTPDQFLRPPEIRSKKMKNLYFVGAWVIGGGFTPAILSGDMCAKEIDKA